MDIKIFWSDTEKAKESVVAKKSELTVEEKIMGYLKQNQLEPEDVFNSIDKNMTGMISYE